jgi:hypothetical protein
VVISLSAFGKDFCSSIVVCTWRVQSASPRMQVTCSGSVGTKLRAQNPLNLDRLHLVSVQLISVVVNARCCGGTYNRERRDNTGGGSIQLSIHISVTCPLLGPLVVFGVGPVKAFNMFETYNATPWPRGCLL